MRTLNSGLVKFPVNCAWQLFVDPAIFESLPQIQRKLFRTADMLLTGAVLGGGSDALHQLVSVFTNFMESAARRAKG